jgi:hypothetical protein
VEQTCQAVEVALSAGLGRSDRQIPARS